MAAHIGRHVADYKIKGAAAEQFFETRQHVRLAEVALNEGHAVHRFHRQDVEREHFARRARQLGCRLRPASRRAAQVGQHRAGLDEFVFFVDFQKFVGGAGAVAVFLRLMDVVVVHMFAQPCFRRFGACRHLGIPKHKRPPFYTIFRRPPPPHDAPGAFA